MDSDKSLELDLAMVSPRLHSDPNDSICSNSPRKRICDDDDECDSDLVDLQVKKTRIDENDRDSVMVVELAPLMNEANNLMSKDEKTPVSTPGTEYFEFIKTQNEDFSGHSSQLIDGINNKSPSQNGPNENGDREGLSTGQQYYIAVDARTVATLQAGAEYTLVPVDQGGKGATDERQGSFDEESCQMWSGSDGQMKESEQPQQMLIQTMRPLSSNPSSPQMYCQEMNEENRDGSLTNGQNSDTEGLNGSNGIYSNVEGPDTPNRKIFQSLPPTNSQMQNNRAGCSSMGNMKYDTPNRFQAPTSNSPAGYPVMSAPPHVMYNVPPSNPHHPNNPPPFGYAGHRVHLPPPGPAWHSSPYSQSYSPHNAPGFAPNQPVTQPPSMNLSSSGEEQENVSPEYPRFSQNEQNSDGNLFPISAIQRTPNMAGILGPLDNMQYFPIPYTGRENHNEKERKRRSRIKNACSLLRDLVPGLSEKTDKATVFEYTVQYLLHLKRHVGKQFDKEFMEKYTPY